jgi:hypothetical protein
VKQILEMLEKLEGKSITRRNLLQLTAIGTSLVLLNTLAAKTDAASCSLPTSIVSCKEPSNTTQTTSNFSASVLRKEDMLALRFDFYNLRLNGTNLERLNSIADSFIVVNFAHGNDFFPQSIGEEAYLETAEELNNDTEDPDNVPNPPGGSETPDQPGYVGARFSGGSRLVFKVPGLPDGPKSIPFTMDELLSWEKYEMNVAPTALPVDNQIQGQEPVEPGLKETAIEAPWKLIVSPNSHAGWAHTLRPVTRNNRTELWHTRLGVRTSDTLNPSKWLIDEQHEYYRTLRAIWAQGFDIDTTPDANNLSPFRMSLTDNDRWQLVRLTSDYNISIAALIPLYYNPAPIHVEHFMLSTLGAWMDTRGEWPDAPATANLDIIEWRHLSTMARDHYVRVVYKGFLFPTGHAATLVKITERKFQAVPINPLLLEQNTLAGKPAAYLRQRFYIVVRQPLKTFPAHDSQPYGGREWPFESVRITTLVTPTLDDPGIHGDEYDLAGQGQKAFWPRIGGQDFLFHMVAMDSDNQRTEFTCPLAFISSTLQQSDDVSSFIEPALSSYNTGSTNKYRRERPLQGQKVAFAHSSRKDGLPDGKPGDTSAEVKTLILGATLPSPPGVSLPDNQPRFFPKWQEAEVRLPAAEQASGSALPGPVVIQLHPDFRDSGFIESTNPGFIWAKLKNKVDLSFNGSGDKSGGIVTPNIKIGGLSRTIGVVGGDVNPAAPTQFDPFNFFSDAKILGGILLADIIKAANFGDGRKTPHLTNYIIYPDGNNSLPPQALETRLDWAPELQPDPFNVFEPSSVTSMEVNGTFITPLDPPGEPAFNIVGDLRNFWMNILGDEFLFLRLHFNKVTFTTETGKKPNVDVDINQVEFTGVLTFVNALKDFMKNSGTGLNIDITPAQVSAGFTLPIPTIAFGVVTCQNISLGAKLTIPFTGNPARVRFNFCERERPFLLTIYAFGGGGFFAIEVGLDGVERLEAALEFGASVALNIGVASGEVHVMGGIYYEMEKVGQPDESASLTSYIRMGGSLEVLGIITISVEFYLGMTYQITANELWGQAKLTVKVKVLFFSAKVELSVERRLAGGGDSGSSSSSYSELRSPDWSISRPVERSIKAASAGGGNFEDLMALDDWTEYTEAFAPVPVSI